MVLEEDTINNDYRILKTAYNAQNSGWISDWLSQTPRRKRVLFVDYFRGKTLSIHEC